MSTILVFGFLELFSLLTKIDFFACHYEMNCIFHSLPFHFIYLNRELWAKLSLTFKDLKAQVWARPINI